MMRYSVVIPAAGKGERLGLGYNKILYKTDDVSIIEKTLVPFIEDGECSDIVLVCSKNDLENLTSFIKHPKVSFTIGGSCREESVYNGLKCIKENLVLIHDGARPFASMDLIDLVKTSLAFGKSVVPVVKSKDATIINGRYQKDSEVMLVQTPQAFYKKTILEAFEIVKEKDAFESYKDDASLVQDILGIKPFLVNGDYKNIKITTVSDLKSLEVEKNA